MTKDNKSENKCAGLQQMIESFFQMPNILLLTLGQQDFGLPMWITTYFFTSLQVMILCSSCLISGAARIFITIDSIHNNYPNRNYGLVMDHNLLLNLLANSTLDSHVLKYMFLLSSF